MLYATVRQRKIQVKRPETVIQNGRGVDYVTLNMDDEWAKMAAIWCVFTLRYQVQQEQDKVDENGNPVKDDSGNQIKETVTVTEEVARAVPHVFGEVLAVPWECLEHTGLLSLACTGYNETGELRMTTMMADSFWTVVQNGPIEGDEVGETPTPTLVDQARVATSTANAAAENANAAAEQLRKDKENGVFDGVSPTVEIGTVTEGTQAQVTNSGTNTEVKLDFVLPRGANGRGIQSMTAKGDTVTVQYSDGTSQSFAVKSGGVSSWDDLQGKPVLISNLAYNEETGELTIVYADGNGIVGFRLATQPVKGVDYWTEEDIAEIKAYVDEVILGGVW